MSLDDDLRAAGSRLRDHTTSVAPDLTEVVQRSGAQRRRGAIAATMAGFVVVVFAVAAAGVQLGERDTSISVFGNGNNAPTPLASTPAGASTTTTTTTPNGPLPEASHVSDAIGGGAPCDAATFGAAVTDTRQETVTAVERFACINNWAAARIVTAESGANTFIFHIEGKRWMTVSSDVEGDAKALEAVGAPLNALYRIMGLARSPIAATTTSVIGPPLSIVEIDEASRPPAALLAKITTQFLTDIGDPAVADTIGTTIRVFDGYVLSATTMRTFDDADRDAVGAALVGAGFVVEFIPYVDTNTPQLPTLVFADPSLHREPVEIEAGSFAVYVEISGCEEECGYGADYLGRPDTDAGWMITPVFDAETDPPVTAPETTEPPTDPSTTDVEAPEGASGTPDAPVTVTVPELTPPALAGYAVLS